MSRVTAPVEWAQSAEELHDLYRWEKDAERRKRLAALWLVRQGRPLYESSQAAGIGYRTLQRWLSWYRQGGLVEVIRRVPGHCGPGRPCRLNAEQMEDLWWRSSRGQFRTCDEARVWVEQEWGITYSYNGIHTLLARLNAHHKESGPAVARSGTEAQEARRAGSGT